MILENNDGRRAREEAADRDWRGALDQRETTTVDVEARHPGARRGSHVDGFMRRKISRTSSSWRRPLLTSTERIRTATSSITADDNERPSATNSPRARQTLLLHGSGSRRARIGGSSKERGMTGARLTLPLAPMSRASAWGAGRVSSCPRDFASAHPVPFTYLDVLSTAGPSTCRSSPIFDVAHDLKSIRRIGCSIRTF